MTKNRFNPFLAVFAGGTLAFLAALLMLAEGSNSSTTSVDTLQDRAHRVFVFDRSHPGKLPRRDLYALSMAMKFGNVSGAHQIIARLEPALR